MMPVKCTSHMDAEVWAGHVKYFHMVHDADFTGLSKRPHEPGMQVMRALYPATCISCIRGMELVPSSMAAGTKVPKRAG